MPTLPIAVVLPVHNAEPWLDACLESLSRQSYSAFRIYAIDDASSDASPEILNAWHSRLHEKLILLSGNKERPRGVAACLNQLIEASAEPIIARMDADDLSHRDRLGKQAEFLERNPDVAVCGSAFAVLEQGRCTATVTPPIDDSSIRARILFASPFCHPSVCMRRSMLVKVAGPYSVDAPPLEDLDLWMRLSSLGRFANLETPLLSYRRHPNQSTARKDGRLPQRMLKLRTDFLRSLGMGIEATDTSSLAQTSMEHFIQDTEPGSLARVSRFLARMVRSEGFQNWCGEPDLAREVAAAWWRCVRRQKPSLGLAFESVRMHPCLDSDAWAGARCAKVILAALRTRPGGRT